MSMSGIIRNQITMKTKWYLHHIKIWGVLVMLMVVCATVMKYILWWTFRSVRLCVTKNHHFPFSWFWFDLSFHVFLQFQVNFSWFQVGFQGFSRFKVGFFSWFCVPFFLIPGFVLWFAWFQVGLYPSWGAKSYIENTPEGTRLNCILAPRSRPLGLANPRPALT